MKIIDHGGGTPIVVIPGAQGRWEWMKPAIDALARRCRVITFSLADEPTCGAPFDPHHGFSSYVDQVRDALDACGIQRGAICGVSYGGLIAAAFAARHPDRTASLVLVSALPPSWKPDRRVRFYLRAPRLLTPVSSGWRSIDASHCTRRAIRPGESMLATTRRPCRTAASAPAP